MKIRQITTCTEARDLISYNEARDYSRKRVGGGEGVTVRGRDVRGNYIIRFIDRIVLLSDKIYDIRN